MMQKIIFLLLALTVFVYAQSLVEVKSYMFQNYLIEKLDEKEIFIDETSLHVKGDFALLKTPPKIKDGRDSFDYFLDVDYNVCLQKEDGVWKVIYDLSRSDVPSTEEWREIQKSFPQNFPKELLSEFWQKGL